MIDKQAHFKELLERLRAGDVSAADELVERYGPHICRAIRRRFRSRKLRILYSTEDCLQSVWQSVFGQMDRIAELESPEHLMRYLTRVACNKLVDQNRHLHAQRNDVDREFSLANSHTADQHKLVDPGPSPSAQAAVQDEWDQKTQGLSSEKRTILEMSARGHTSEEIAEQTSYSGRGIRRVLSQLGELFVR
ncbi:MAG: sigma-70 family RNA polymerase sigma factor [Planctomycetes bacterium]|nr:sigma-70 family RNA polymerase sigma factor [Planctomycetota bacterium]